MAFVNKEYFYKIKEIDKAMKNLNCCYEIECSKDELDINRIQGFVDELTAILDECPNTLRIK